MRLPRTPHSWSLSPRKAVALQRELAGRVRCRGPQRPIRRVAGLDCASSPDGRRCLAAVVVWDAELGEVIESHVVSRPMRFPYVPGLLSFREAPAALAALRRLRTRPDALMCDGHGLAHSRRFGLACHLGVLTGLPSVGCAKSRYVGQHRDPGQRRGARTALVDRAERVGTVLRTRAGVKPVFVSVGHRFTLSDAERLVLRCAVGYRLPEPTRLADRLAAAARRDLAQGASAPAPR